jgi:hypothetical protein
MVGEGGTSFLSSALLSGDQRSLLVGEAAMASDREERPAADSSRKLPASLVSELPTSLSRLGIIGMQGDRPRGPETSTLLLVARSSLATTFGLSLWKKLDDVELDMDTVERVVSPQKSEDVDWLEPMRPVEAEVGAVVPEELLSRGPKMDILGTRLRGCPTRGAAAGDGCLNPAISM